MSKYLEFHLIELKLKTKVISVDSKLHGNTLGIIKWYGAWRQYVFYPKIGTLFNAECLNDIQNQIKEMMDERSEKK